MADPLMPKGTTAIQLAREFGAISYVTVGNSKKAHFVKS